MDDFNIDNEFLAHDFKLKKVMGEVRVFSKNDHTIRVRKIGPRTFYICFELPTPHVTSDVEGFYLSATTWDELKAAIRQEFKKNMIKENEEMLSTVEKLKDKIKDKDRAYQQLEELF